MKALQRQVAAIARTAARPTTGAAVQTETRQRRFVPKGLVSTRKRLGLSAAELASLLGVTAQTIYNWERGATRPGPELHSKLVALRGVGKREVTAHLATLRQASTG
ncbi:MAG: helix-turn-helix domain-containing protein [Burkholderiaceae bacterium]|nr:helix-turn-helix domain-containing protein [Burkholderiaceae bacterium]